MKSQAKRLAILSLPEARELYSVPQLSPHEQDYFFTLSEAELAAVNRLDLLRNRIHLTAYATSLTLKATHIRNSNTDGCA